MLLLPPSVYVPAASSCTSLQNRRHAFLFCYCSISCACYSAYICRLIKLAAAGTLFLPMWPSLPYLPSLLPLACTLSNFWSHISPSHMPRLPSCAMGRTPAIMILGHCRDVPLLSGQMTHGILGQEDDGGACACSNWAQPHLLGKAHILLYMLPYLLQDNLSPLPPHAFITKLSTWHSALLLCLITSLYYSGTIHIVSSSDGLLCCARARRKKVVQPCTLLCMVFLW